MRRPTVLCLMLLAMAMPCLPQKVGAGKHQILEIQIEPKTDRASSKEDNLTLRVGQKLPLKVVAAWAIPYVGDVTDKATLTVDKPQLAKLDNHAVVTARRPGEVVIEAALRVSDNGGMHEVLASNENAGAYPVIRFTDRLRVKIIR